jgi:hypothetical protein
MKELKVIESISDLMTGDLVTYIGTEGLKIPGFTPFKEYYIQGNDGYEVILINDNSEICKVNFDNIKNQFRLPVDKEDKVNHPSHYTWLKEKCGIEVIDIIRHLDFDLGNSIKYILRAGRKPIETENKSDFYAGTIQDLKKAVWYLNDKIKMLEENER